MAEHMTQEDLKKIVLYSWRSGLFRTKGIRVMRGHSLNGYVALKIHGKIYYAHRLAWLYMTGTWPQGEIDHKNGQRADNRWNNLRLATPQQNCFNRKGTGCHGKGVFFVNDRFRRKPYAAKIVVSGKIHYLGYFSTREEAQIAYQEASSLYHGKFGRPK